MAAPDISRRDFVLNGLSMKWMLATSSHCLSEAMVLEPSCSSAKGRKQSIFVIEMDFFGIKSPQRYIKKVINALLQIKKVLIAPLYSDSFRKTYYLCPQIEQKPRPLIS